MGLELFATVEDAVALFLVFAVGVDFAWGFRCTVARFLAEVFISVSNSQLTLSTFPSLDSVMLGIFVAFPVVLAAKTFITGVLCAAIGARMSFHVFSMRSVHQQSFFFQGSSSVRICTSGHIEFSSSCDTERRHICRVSLDLDYRG